MLSGSKGVHVLVTILLSGGYNNVQPRDTPRVEKGWKQDMISRAAGAHANSWEAFTGISAAVFMAILSGKDIPDLLLMCNGFLWLRILYIPCYVLGVNMPISLLRSACFAGGVIIILKIMVDAVSW